MAQGAGMRFAGYQSLAKADSVKLSFLY